MNREELKEAYQKELQSRNFWWGNFAIMFEWLMDKIDKGEYEIPKKDEEECK